MSRLITRPLARVPHLAWMLALTALPLPLLAAPVQMQHEGVQLNANLELAAGKTVQDGVVLITHGTLAHNGMELIQTLQQGFKERGLSSLAINLSLGLSDRAAAMYDCPAPHRHRHEDAEAEIKLWTDWLKGQGATEVVLMGHSRGGNQTARALAAAGDDPAVKAGILLAPATYTVGYHAKDFETRYGKPLKPLLEQAEALVKAGKGEELIKTDFIYCAETQASAQAVLSYYREDPRLDTPTVLAEIKTPVLVIAGSADDVVADLPARMTGKADGQRVRYVEVDGADHFFMDLYAEEVLDAAQAFLSETTGWR